jgi:hypothetical protein
MVTKHWEDQESRLHNIAVMLPGVLIWIIIFSPVWAGQAFPLVMTDLLIVLSIYWLYRAFLTTLGTSIGLWKVRQDIKKDWLEECHKLNKYELPEPDSLPVGQLLPKHLIVYPQRVPHYDVLRTTLEGIKKQNYPLELIYIVVSFEERAVIKMPEGAAQAVQDRIRSEFPEFGDRLMFFVHPDGLPGEVIGAGPNRTWGAKNAVKLLEADGETISDFLVTSPDEDIVFHPEYLAACTFKYLTTENRKQRFYQTALYTFNNNYWQVPILVRVLVASLTIPVLSSSVLESHKRETFSCFTLSLEVLKKVDYWDTSYGIDDTTFYWRPYFYFNGDWECEIFYIPLSTDAIYNPNYLQNHKEQYKQYLRWGWGVVSFPIGFKGLLRKPGIPFAKRMEKLLHLFEVFVFWKVLVYLLTFGVPIVLLLNPEFSELVVSISVPNTLSGIMGLSLIFLIPNTIYKAIIAPPRPKSMPFFKYFLLLLIEAPLNIITIFLYSTLPFVEASTRMMVGQKEAKAVTWSTKVR